MENEVIVELLGEGGSRALYGVRVNNRWLFAMELIAQVAPATTSSGAPAVDSWSAAMKLLDSNFGWPGLTPRNVHPEFRAPLLLLVTERAARDPGMIDLARWESACSLNDSSAPLIVSAPVHSSDAWLYDEVDELEPSDAEIESQRNWLRALGIDEATIHRMAPPRKLQE